MTATPAHRHFHDELSELKVKLLTMSGEAQSALAAAVDALLSRDADAARQVITGDHRIDVMEIDVEEMVMRLLATQQPMARDLRLLTAATKIANDLERVGDHAVNIAQSAERLFASRPSCPNPRSSRWPARRGRCSPTRSRPSSGATRPPAARSASGTTRWTNSTGRCSASCSPT
jgi:hypothetical protein